MHGRRIALSHYGRAGSPLLRPSELSLQSGICKHKPREVPRRGVRLVFCERGYTSLSIWGYCFLQLPAKDALVPALS